MRIFFFYITFSTTLLLGQQDSNRIVTNSVLESTKSIDTLNMEVVKTLPQNFCERNEGTLIGALLAGLIAVFSVWFTNHCNIKRINKLNKKLYYGLLTILKSELEYQSEIINFLIEEIKVTGETVKNRNDLGLKKPFRKIQTKFIDETRNKLLSIELKDTDLLKLLTAFINKCELLNADLNYEVIYIFYANAKENNKLEDFVKIFFGEMHKQISDTLSAISPIIAFIDFEIDKNK